MLEIVKKCEEQEKQIKQLRLVINDYIVDLAEANRKVEEYKTMYELEQKIVVADELRIMKALDYAKILNKRIPVKIITYQQINMRGYKCIFIWNAFLLSNLNDIYI